MLTTMCLGLMLGGHTPIGVVLAGSGGYRLPESGLRIPTEPSRDAGGCTITDDGEPGELLACAS